MRMVYLTLVDSINKSHSVSTVSGSLHHPYPFAVPGKDLKKHLPWKSWIRCARQRLNQTSAAIVRPLETVTADSFFLFLMFCLEISTFGSQLFCFNQGVFFGTYFCRFDLTCSKVELFWHPLKFKRRASKSQNQSSKINIRKLPRLAQKSFPHGSELVGFSVWRGD